MSVYLHCCQHRWQQHVPLHKQMTADAGLDTVHKALGLTSKRQQINVYWFPFCAQDRRSATALRCTACIKHEKAANMLCFLHEVYHHLVFRHKHVEQHVTRYAPCSNPRTAPTSCCHQLLECQHRQQDPICLMPKQVLPQCREQGCIADRGQPSDHHLVASPLQDDLCLPSCYRLADQQQSLGWMHACQLLGQLLYKTMSLKLYSVSGHRKDTQ